MTTTSRPAMPSTEVGGAHRNKWLPWLSVFLLLVGVGIGAFLGRVTKADISPPPDLAATSVTKMLTDLATAVNAGDAAAIATFYAPAPPSTNRAYRMGRVCSPATPRLPTIWPAGRNAAS